jgi:hypothetical protein
MIFKHNIRNFNAAGILAQLGITPAQGVAYYQLSSKIEAIIETQVLTAAERLNQLLKETYARDMGLIPEYVHYPDYFTVMDVALSQSRNIGFYYDETGLIQAKFVDLDGLGDRGDLQRIQKIVHPGGTLAGWIGIYNAWLSGISRKYEEIVGARVSIMLSETKAPFWELIEGGNGEYAYPRNGPMRTLSTFVATYDSEMRAAYLRTLSVAKSLVSTVSVQNEIISYDNKMFSGEIFYSQGGNNIFVISGTTTVDKLGRVAGKGFIIDSAGLVLRRWSGWLPK